MNLLERFKDTCDDMLLEMARGIKENRNFLAFELKKMKMGLMKYAREDSEPDSE
jgi:hypothetical protein